MTDLELVKKCAEAMGLGVCVDEKRVFSVTIQENSEVIHEQHELYDPLDDDAQNAALDNVLLKHGEYEMRANRFVFWSNCRGADCIVFQAEMTIAANRRRARVECVAKIGGRK